MGNKLTAVLTLSVGMALLATGCDQGVQPRADPPQGTWVCTSTWRCDDRAGGDLSCAWEAQVTCEGGALTSVGVVSIGPSQWAEQKKGTCDAKDQELFSVWKSVKTTTMNQAAKQFEQEKLSGRSLGSTVSATSMKNRVVLLHRTDNQFNAIHEEGRLITCHRP